MNKRISPKERGLIKGALRRVFSRSDLRKAAIDASRIEHVDADRPRVKKWSKCPICKIPTPTYQMEVDHKEPIIPVDRMLEDMDWDEVVNRIWCGSNNLVAICKVCHNTKTSEERKARNKAYKERKANKK